MADINQDPMIKIIGFKTTFERLPVRGEVLDENLDEKGFLLDAKGKRVMKDQDVDWVTYAPAHSPLNTQNCERIKHVLVSDDMMRGDVTDRLRFMAARWSQIAPAYAAWKSGQEIPLNGTPLAAWAGVTAEKAEVLRRFSIRTVEEVRDLSEGQMEKVQLPGMRELRKAAAIFLEGRGAAESAAREADRDNEIAALKAQLEETNARFSAAMDLLEAQTAPVNEIDKVRAELDERGIKYHHKAGLDSLKALLVEEAA